MRHGFYDANLMQSVTFDREELKFLNKKKTGTLISFETVAQTLLFEKRKKVY